MQTALSVYGPLGALAATGRARRYHVPSGATGMVNVCVVPGTVLWANVSRTELPGQPRPAMNTSVPGGPAVGTREKVKNDAVWARPWVTRATPGGWWWQGTTEQGGAWTAVSTTYGDLHRESFVKLDGAEPQLHQVLAFVTAVQQSGVQGRGVRGGWP